MLVQPGEKDSKNKKNSKPCFPPGIWAWWWRHYAVFRICLCGSGTRAEPSQCGPWQLRPSGPNSALPGQSGRHRTQVCMQKTLMVVTCEHCQQNVLHSHTGRRDFLPCIFIMLDGHQGIFHSFVDQGVDTGHKEVYGSEQSFPIFTQELLCFCIISKLVLQRKAEVLPTDVSFTATSLHSGSPWNILPVTLGTSGRGQWRCLPKPAVSAPCFGNDWRVQWPVSRCFHTCF